MFGERNTCSEREKNDAKSSHQKSLSLYFLNALYRHQDTTAPRFHWIHLNNDANQHTEYTGNYLLCNF